MFAHFCFIYSITKVELFRRLPENSTQENSTHFKHLLMIYIPGSIYTLIQIQKASMQFHGNGIRMDPYGSMHGIAWKTYEFGSGYSLFVLLIIYTFATIFLKYLCLRLNFFYRFVSWFGPMYTTFQREKQFNIGKNRNHD